MILLNHLNLSVFAVFEVLIENWTLTKTWIHIGDFILYTSSSCKSSRYEFITFTLTHLFRNYFLLTLGPLSTNTRPNSVLVKKKEAKQQIINETKTNFQGQ